MFNRIKQSMTIEKGYLIWKEIDLDVKNLISKLPFSQASAYREGLREMQTKMGLEQHDVAIMMIVPFLDAFDFTTRFDINRLVKRWYQDGLVQPDVFNFFKSKLNDPRFS